MKSFQPTLTRLHPRSAALALRSLWFAAFVLFSAAFAQAAQLTLTWSDNSSNETGFEVERATATTGPFTRVTTVGSNATTYTDTSVQTNTRYYYRVRAYNAAGVSQFTDVADAIAPTTTTEPVPPTKTDQTITFAPLPGRTYGAASFTLSSTASSGLPVTFSSSNTSVAAVSGNVVTIKGAGSTTITASQAGNTSYNPAPSVQQTLTVNKAVMTVTADSKSMTVGSSVPALSATLSGYVYGQTLSTSGITGSASLTTTATSSSLAGTYPITASAGTLSAANYSFQFVNGSLTVNAAPVATKTSQSISFGSLAARTYGAAAFTLSASASSGLPVSYTSSNTGVATISGNTVTIRGAGSTVITASQAGDATYAAAVAVNQTLTVNKAPLSVRADSKAKYTGEDVPPLTATLTGFVNGQTSTTAGITGTPALATTATKNSPAGTYPIMVSLGSLSSTNYSFSSFVNGTLTITKASGRKSKLSNLSVRSDAGSGDETLIVGFAVSTTEEKSLLVRGIGPSLKEYGVESPLSDPSLSVYVGRSAMQANDDWASGSDAEGVASACAAAQAFPISVTSKDAAVLTRVGTAVYTAQVAGKSADKGIALAEIYDTDDVMDSRLVNVSARANITTGDNVLIAGFVIKGTEPLKVLVRAVGPTLSGFGVANALQNPRLTLMKQGDSTPLAENDNWGSAGQLGSAFASVGAFALPDGSPDAAIVVTLEPGSYSAVVSGVNDTKGVALVEVYEMP